MPEAIEKEQQQHETQQQEPNSNQEHEDSIEKPPVKRKPLLWGHPVRILILVVVVAALAIGGVMFWTCESTFESTDDAQVDAHIYSVSPRVGGRVTAVRADNNQSVALGQVLVELDPTDYKVALQRVQADQAQAEADARAAASQIPITTTNTASQLTGAGASVEEASAGISVAQQQQEAAQARVREAEANAAKAEKDVERYRPLAAKQEVSQQQFDQAVANARALAATVETAQANAEAARRQISQARARLSQAQAQQAATRSGSSQVAAERARAQAMVAAIGVQRAAVEQARLNMQYTQMLAPVAGVVGQRSVQPGQQVQAGQQILSIIPVHDAWITANFKETQLKKMRVGQRATVRVDATGRDYKGHVESFPGATGSRYSLLPPENATGNYVKVVQRLPVKIVLESGEDKDNLLRPGMSAEPKVYVK